MRTLFVIITIVVLTPGCQTNKVKLVWDTSGKPVNAENPAGFAISPAEAYAKVWEAKRLSPKHIWHIYADNQNYYIIDSFLGSSPRQALKTGVIIDGQTGEIKN